MRTRKGPGEAGTSCFLPCLDRLLRIAPCPLVPLCRPAVDISVGGDGNQTGVGAGQARTEFRSVAAAAKV